MGLNENMQIIQTVLDKDGNLRKKNAVDYKEIKILTLTQNPFVWTEILKKDTDNLNEDFVKNILESNEISFEELKRNGWWYPFYYLTFLMEISRIIEEKGVESLKSFLRKIVKLKSMVDDIPDDLNNNTRLSEISEVFSIYTQIEYVLIVLE